MVETRRTGRTPHELVEVPPSVLACGHPLEPGRVIIGYDSRDVDSPRCRVWTCRHCGTDTWDQP